MIVERTVEMPTSAIVGQAACPISEMHGRVRLVRAPEIEMRELDEVVPELVELRPVEPELMLELGALGVGQVPSTEERADRVRLDDPEEEEVEDDDERQRPQRAENLAADVSDAQRRAGARSAASASRSRLARTRSPAAARSMSTPTTRPPVSGAKPDFDALTGFRFAYVGDVFEKMHRRRCSPAASASP